MKGEMGVRVVRVASVTIVEVVEFRVKGNVVSLNTEYVFEKD